MENQYPIPAGKQPLRFAVMCNGMQLQQWQLLCLEEIIRAQIARPVLLVVNDAPGVKKTFFQKVSRYPYRHALYRISKRISGHPLRAVAPLPVIFNTLEQVHCRVEKKGKYSEYFSPENIEKIKSYKLDFIVRFGFNIIRGEILNAAKYGVWSFHHGDETRYRGGPPCFWEIYHNQYKTGAILQRLTDKLDGGIVLKKGFFPVTNHSYTDTMDGVYRLSAGWIKQVCIDIYNNEAAYINKAPSPTHAKIYTYPHNGQMLLYGLKQIGRKLAFHYRDVCRPERWKTGLVKQDTATLLAGGINQDNIKWFAHNSKSGYYADPFIIKTGEKTMLLAEEYLYTGRKGVIAAIDPETGETKQIYATSFHHSYPFTLEHNSQHYCLPETHQSGHITLYKVEADLTFSTRYVLVENVNAYDPTLVYHDNKWWLFFTRSETNSNTCLHVYWSGELTGPYMPHANNPVKTDIGSSRPAGNLFYINNELYRPAQNCARTYGGSVVLHRVTRLTETGFAEEPVNELFAPPGGGYTRGMHTLASSGGYIAIDVKKHRFNRAHFRYKLSKKLGFK